MNLALEEYLLDHCGDEECILYLWQNARTVVIGRNQDPWRECQVSLLREDGGHLARRLSGGGSVYHDLGNLNYSFIAKKCNYDTSRQTEVICTALKSFGVKAEVSGRNDIAVGGRKVSGNAFYERGDRCCHHGTIMLSVDVNVMSRYLTASSGKLASKSVPSVRERVTNIVNIAPKITVNDAKEAMVSAFAGIYKRELTRLDPQLLDKEDLKVRTLRFRSEEWLFGRQRKLPQEMAKRFSWGEVTARVSILEGRITDVILYSDAMDAEWMQLLQKRLKNVAHTENEIIRAVYGCPVCNELQTTMRADMAQWLPELEKHNG